MTRLHPLLAIAAGVAVVAGLRLGKPLLVPVALAVVLSLLLAPLVRALERRRIPRAAAAPLVVLLFAAAVAGLGVVVTGQAVSLARQLPAYREEIQAKLGSLQPVARMVEHAGEVVDEIAREAERGERRDDREPVRVEVVDSGADQLTLASGALSLVADVAKTVAVALLLVMFLLVNQSDLVDRIIRLAGPGQVTLTTRALYDAAAGVSRYLGTQALVNGGFGLTLAGGLLAIGVPNALLWGLLGALLRFLPYVGPIVGCTLPVLLAFAVFEGWTRPFLTLGWILLLELVLNNLVEPLVYGARTGLSPVAVILSAVFWGWLWGPLGLVLAVPLSVSLAAIGKCIPGLRWLGVVLGSEAPIDPSVALYHRLLAEKQAEALDLIDRTRGEERLEETFDRLLLPVLSLAGADLERGGLDPRRAAAVVESVRQLAAELADEQAAAEPAAGESAQAATVLCLPASEPVDEVACDMLARSLSLAGHRAVAGTLAPLTAEKADLVAELGAEVACVAAVGPAHLLRLRYLYRKLRQRYPDLPIVVVACGHEEDDLARLATRVAPDGKGTVAGSIADALREARAAAQVVSARREAAIPAPRPALDLGA